MKINYLSFQKLDGEEILLEEPIHWKNYLWSMTLLLLCIIMLLVRSATPEKTIIGFLAGGELFNREGTALISTIEMVTFSMFALYLFARIAKVACIRYFVTNKRIICLSGFFTIVMKEMRIERCETVQLKQNVYERLFNCGDIICFAPGSEILLDDVKDAERFKQTIMNLLTDKDHADRN